MNIRYSSIIYTLLLSPNYIFSITLFVTADSFFILLLLFGFCHSASVPSVQGVLTTQDKDRLVQLLKNKEIDSLEAAFYVSQGLGILGDASTVSGALFRDATSSNRYFSD